MSETSEQVNNQEEFGIGAETSSSNLVSFPAGFRRADLTMVKAHEIGKGEKKFFVLDFKFQSPDRINTLVHREFIPKGKATQKETEAENYNTRKGWFNSRVKHIFEAYSDFPKEGLGSGAKSWTELFQKIAQQFNTGKDGKEIYYNYNGETATCIPVWLKVTYSNDGDIQIPLLPNFIERMTAESHAANAPKTLEKTKYDSFEAPPKKGASASPAMPGGVFGGPAPAAKAGGSDMGF